jgi:hypothetical protein
MWETIVDRYELKIIVKMSLKDLNCIHLSCLISWAKIHCPDMLDNK